MSAKKLVALLCALLFVIGISAGCSNKQAETTPAPTATSDTGDKGTPTTSDPADEKDSGVKFPLDEPVTFKIWAGPMSTTANMTTPNDSLAYQEAERRLNV
ncbi:MAG: hypothetical protein GX193_06045, partial [Clostridiales bacterium]|nr:hypothetical protein [Clostridiales bacterium]